jgi:hypothetical protein
MDRAVWRLVFPLLQRTVKGRSVETNINSTSEWPLHTNVTNESSRLGTVSGPTCSNYSK